MPPGVPPAARLHGSSSGPRRWSRISRSPPGSPPQSLARFRSFRRSSPPSAASPGSCRSSTRTARHTLRTSVLKMKLTPTLSADSSHSASRSRLAADAHRSWPTSSPEAGSGCPARHTDARELHRTQAQAVALVRVARQRPATSPRPGRRGRRRRKGGGVQAGGLCLLLRRADLTSSAPSVTSPAAAARSGARPDAPVGGRG